MQQFLGGRRRLLQGRKVAVKKEKNTSDDNKKSVYRSFLKRAWIKKSPPFTWGFCFFLHSTTF